MYLLFDFDGTLVDSFNCVVKNAMSLATKMRFRKLKDDEIDYLRSLTSIEVIKYLQIPIYKIPKLIYQMRKNLHDEMLTLVPFAGIPQLLEQLHSNGFKLGILTSNSVENVKIWLEHHKLQQYFDFIHVESHFFSKKYLLKKTLKTHALDKSKVFFICDETRDIDAAKKNSIKSVAVTWGYNSEQVLLTYGPTHVVHNPNELLTLVNKALTNA